MTDKIRNLLKDVGAVYQGKGMFVYPNSFDELRTEIMKLDNINRLQSEQIEKMSELINRYYMVCTEIPKELRTMTFDSCMEDTQKMVKELKEWKI